MRKRSFGSIGIVSIGIAFAVASLTPLRVDAADSSKGSFVFKGKTVELKYVYLVKGPDYSSKIIRELVFSPTDISAKIQACADPSCVRGGLNEGMTVDFDAGSRLNYWVVMNGQRVQYSGTADPPRPRPRARRARQPSPTASSDSVPGSGTNRGSSETAPVA